MSNRPRDTPEVAGETQYETAGRIMDAAYALFLDFGLRRLSMEDVARKANLSRMTIYRYYRDKDALFHAVVHRELRRAIRQTHKYLLELNEPEILIEEGFVQIALQARRHPLFKRLLETEPEWLMVLLTLKSEPLFEVAINYCTQLIEEAQDRGGFTGFSAKAAAEILVRLLHSSVLMPGGLMSTEDEEGLRFITSMALSPLTVKD